MKKMLKRTIYLLALAVAVSTTSPALAVNDPIEPVNRAVMKFNDQVDKYLLKPLAKGYDAVMPEFAQAGVGNFFSNLKYPVVVANQFLQGKVKDGFQDTTRFLINTTFGVAGVMDVAKHFGLKENKEDFGQTLGVWGVGSGPYVVLPLLGPATTRGVVGRFADYHVDPMNSDYFDDRDATQNQMRALDIIHTRAQLLKVERLVSGDRYVFVRDAYLQKRQDLINDGRYDANSDPFLDGE